MQTRLSHKTKLSIYKVGWEIRIQGTKVHKFSFCAKILMQTLQLFNQLSARRNAKATEKIGSLSKHDVDESENVIWKCNFAFLNHFAIIQTHYA